MENMNRHFCDLSFFFRWKQNKTGSGAGSFCPARPAIVQTAKAQTHMRLNPRHPLTNGPQYLYPNPPRMGLLRARPVGCGLFAIPSLPINVQVIHSHPLVQRFQCNDKRKPKWRGIERVELHPKDSNSINLLNRFPHR